MQNTIESVLCYYNIESEKYMIQVKQLKKHYAHIEAVKGIDFNVNKGSFFAFLGPNGAGKSTTINMLCTLLEKTSGDIFIDGLEVGKNDHLIRHKIGVVFQHPMLDGKLTVKQNLYIRGSFYGMDKKVLDKRIKSLVTLLDIDYLDQRYKTLSGGQKRKADIARALIHEPELLFLDEPTTGLDPKTRQDVWRVMETLKSQNMTIFLTTHYMEEAAKSDQIVIINKGLVAASGSPDNLKKQYAKDTLRLSGELASIKDYLTKRNISFLMKQDMCEIAISSKVSLDILVDLKDKIESFEMIQATLDDVFLDIIGDLSR